MITAHQYAQQLCQASQPVPAVVAPQTYEPTCLMTWREQVAGADDASDYAVKHQEQVK